MVGTVQLKAATQACIRALGVTRCSELCGGIAEASVYRWANPNEPATIPLHHALVLDRECWIRAGLAPFREVFEANAGAPINDRVAAELLAAARRISPDVVGAAA